MSKRNAYGNVKMRGKRTMKNPCPCCDPIENKKKIITIPRWNKDDLMEEIYRLENLDPSKHSYPKRIASLKKIVESLEAEEVVEEWDSKKYGTGPLTGDY